MKKIIYLVFIILLPLITSSLIAQEYLPSEVEGHQLLTYSNFTLSYNEEHEQADWVAYELTDNEVALDRDRCNCFKRDNNVTTGSATDDDYLNTGFERGHLSPAADNNISELANEESFLMSNMSPQLSGFNKGIWEDLESWVRKQAEIYGKIYVGTGPVFTCILGTLGENDVTIPGYFYKVLLIFKDSNAKTIAFLIPQVGANGNIEDYVVTVNTIETLTGLDFFPDLDDSVENRVESQYKYTSIWSF